MIGFCLLLLARDPGFFWNDDYQVYHLPGLADVARAWEAGEWPLLSPSSWFGGALAGEYQHGIFSIFSNLVVLVVFNLGLPLPATAAVFSMIHLAVLAAGVFVLARQRGLTEDLATVAAIVASLNGWIISWGATDWVSTLTSFVWVPWAWWALERAFEKSRGATRFLLPGFFFYLILARRLAALCSHGWSRLAIRDRARGLRATQPARSMAGGRCLALGARPGDSRAPDAARAPRAPEKGPLTRAWSGAGSCHRPL